MPAITPDKVILGIMIRKKVMHGLMTELARAKNDSGNVLHHKIEEDLVKDRIKSFSKSIFKAYTPDEIKFKIWDMEKPVCRGIYSDISNMIRDKDYKPCEDCFYTHEIINDRRFDIAEMIKKHCSFHPEWPSDTSITKADEIL